MAARLRIAFQCATILALVLTVEAYTVFETKCSTSDTPVSFVSSPDLLEEYKVDASRIGCAGDYIVRSIIDLRNAMKHEKAIQKYADDDNVEWSLTHSFFANMGGFRVESGPVKADLTDAGSNNGQQLQVLNDNANETIHSAEPTDDQNRDGMIVSSVIGPQLLRLRKHNIISRLPDITKSEIEDKSKSNASVKLIAAGQSLWVCVQVISRGVRGLATTQLEIATLASCVCTIIIWILLFHKPQNVLTPVRPVYCSDGRSEAHKINPRSYETVLFIWGVNGYEAIMDKYPLARVPNDIASTSNGGLGGLSIPAQYATGAIFGLIHFAAYYFEFPTPVERFLWGVASYIIALILPLSAISVLAVQFIFRGFKQEWVHPWIWGGSSIYVIARLYILVETFRSLLFLPPDVFISTWASNIPHV